MSVEILTLTILGFFVIAKCEYIFSFFGRVFAKLTPEHTQQFITVLVSYGISLVAISLVNGILFLCRLSTLPLCLRSV